MGGAPASSELTPSRPSAYPSAAAPTPLASIASLLSQRSRLTPLVSTLATSLAAFAARLLEPAAGWSVDAGETDWSTEAHGESSGVAALSAFLRWLAPRLGPLGQTVGSDFLPAVQPHLLPALSALLPRELPEPLTLPTEAAELARELHAALSLFLPTPTHYLKNDLQPLLAFASSQGGEWTKSLCQHALEAARALLLDTRGWDGQMAELSVADLIAPAPAPPSTEEGANGDEGSEASWDWSAAAGGEDAAAMQENAASPSSSTAAASSAPGRRKGKATLGGVRVVRPGAQLGSGPLPEEGEEDAWGFEEDALDVPAATAAQPGPRDGLQSPDGAHVAPIEVPEDDAWFADEDVHISPADTSAVDPPRGPSSSALAPEADLDEEDVDEDAWGLSEAEKARRASLRGIPAGWVPPPEPTLEGTLEEDEGAEQSMSAPSAATDVSPIQEPASSHAPISPQRQEVEPAGAGVSISSGVSAVASEAVDNHAAEQGSRSTPALHTRATASTSMTSGTSSSQIAAPLLSDDDDDLDDAWGLTEAEQVARAERRASRAFGNTFAFANLDSQKAPQPRSSPAAPAADAPSEPFAGDMSPPRTGVVEASASTSQSRPSQEEQSPSALADHAAPVTAASAAQHDNPAAVPTSAHLDAPESATAVSAADPATAMPASSERELAPSHGLNVPPVPAKSQEAREAAVSEDGKGVSSPSATSLVEGASAVDVESTERSAAARDGAQQEPVALPPDASAQPMHDPQQALPDEDDPWDLEDESVVVPGEALAAKSNEAAAVENGRSDDQHTDLRPRHDEQPDASTQAQTEVAHTLPSTPPAAVHEAAETQHLADRTTAGATRDEDAWGWNDEEASGAADSSAPKLGAAVQLRSSSSGRVTPPRTASPRGADSGIAASPRLRQSALRASGALRSAGTSSPTTGSPSVSRSSSRSTAPPSNQRRRQESASDASFATADKPATPAPLPAPSVEKCQVSARAVALLALVERTLRSAVTLAEHSAQMTDAQRSAWPDGAVLSAAVGDMLDLHCALSPTAHAAQLQSASTAAQFANDCAFIAQATGRLQDLYDGSQLAGREPTLDLTAHAQKTAALGQTVFTAELDRQADLLDAALDAARRFEGVHEAERARSCEAAATRVLEALRQLHATWQPILPAPARLGALGTLVEGVLSRVLREVEALEDISERESEILATVVKSFGPLEELFVDAASGVSYCCRRGCPIRILTSLPANGRGALCAVVVQVLVPLRDSAGRPGGHRLSVERGGRARRL
jgi:hypothetical protein